MTDASTTQAVNKFRAILPRLPVIDRVKYETIEQVYEIEDRFTLNKFMAASVPLLNRADGQPLKNTCYPVVCMSFQRAINDHKEKLWRDDIEAGRVERDSLPIKWNFKTDPHFTFWKKELNKKMQEARKIRGKKQPTKPLKPSHVNVIVKKSLTEKSRPSRLADRCYIAFSGSVLHPNFMKKMNEAIRRIKSSE